MLAAFGRSRGIDSAKWVLATGDAQRTYRLARTFYHADDGRLTGGSGDADRFLHTEKVLLVDRHLYIRGVYNGTVPFDMERLIEDIRALRAGGA